MARRRRVEFALFVRHQTGPGERIVLVFGDQVPGQHGHLAGGGDDGGLEAAAGLDPLDRTPAAAGRPAGRPGRLDQHPAHLGPAGLADPAVHRRGVPGLANLRVQPE